MLLTAMIWGSAFVAQSMGMDHVGPFAFQATRSFIGAAVLLPVIAVMERQKKRAPDYRKPTAAENRLLLKSGIICGIVLGVASLLQQVGIAYTTVGKAGFITAMYLLIVPILGLLFKRKVSARIWFCVAVAVVGMYLLCMTEGLRLSKGDTYVCLCAIAFSVHILVIDRYAPQVDGVKLSCLQFFVAGVLAGIPMLIFERPDMDALLSAWAPILYAGALSSGVGYTLQVIGQKYTHPTVASLIMSLESVFSVLAGVVILSQIPTAREFAGCALMFAAIIISQLPDKKRGADGEIGEDPA